MRRTNLQQHIGRVQQAVQRLPQVAAGELGALQVATQTQQRAPDGSRWKRTVRGGLRFDRFNAIRYEVLVLPPGLVLLQSAHPAAAYSRWGTRYMTARPKVPNGTGLGWWQPRILRALRKWSRP